MKKLLLVLLLLSSTCLTKAQLSVNASGVTTAKKITVNPGDTTTHAGTLNAIAGTLGGSNYKYNIAVSGYSSVGNPWSATTKYGIGVKGQSTYANGMNFGVYGLVIPPSGGGPRDSGYMNYGAGVYGSTKSTIKSLTSTYAGYFDGAVGVYGNISVSGTIDGIVVSRGTTEGSSRASAVTDESSSDVANSLAGLRVSSFYFEPSEDDRSEIEPAEDDGSAESDVSQQDATIMQVNSRKHYALNADQLEEVFPDLVYENEDGTKSINYVEMVPILVQAINELKEEIEVLKGTQTAKKAKTATGMIDKTEGGQILTLKQNKPNPFSTTTEVEVTVPESVQHAFVYVYDLQGKKVQQVDITARGKQTVQLNAASLEEGMYLYSLIADGQVVQTRRMIIEK